MNLVDDPVIAGANPPLPGSAHEPRGRRRSRIAGEQLKCCLDSSADLRIELAQLPGGRGRERDLAGVSCPKCGTIGQRPLTATAGDGFFPPRDADPERKERGPEV